ncbi:hypothetical protein ACFTY8_32295 [Streptomyces mirabilis]|uniref:hypothetical protein n=1 Tax=Streptomyces mirabilis TaxID=68239 RepID=UPI00363D8493
MRFGPPSTPSSWLERMVPPGELLFSHSVHGAMAGSGTGSLCSAALRTRIEDFVTWANAEAARHGLPGEVIPADPHGAVGTRRVRRTLVWHIARRPGGLVALAIRYSHLRTAPVYEGYATPSRDGIHELIDVETVRAVADTVADLIDDLQAAASPARPPGASSRRPSAPRASRAPSSRPPSPAGSSPTTTPCCATTRMRSCLCHCKRKHALCHRIGVRDSPRRDHCVPEHPVTRCAP